MVYAFKISTGNYGDGAALRSIELVFLSNQKFLAQSIGNCWLRQPMLCILTSFYIELLTQRPELSYKQSWTAAQKFFKRWEKATFEEVAAVARTPGLPRDLHRLADRAIADVQSRDAA